MPEEYEIYPLSPGIGYLIIIFVTSTYPYGMLVEVVVVVDGAAVDVVVVVVIQALISSTVPKAASNTSWISAEIVLTSAFGAAMITVESSMM